MSLPAAIFSHFLIVVASKSDEKNHNGRMLASFPLRRRDIVTSKYLGVLLFTTLAFLLTLLWRMLAAMVLPTEELPWFSLQSILISIAVLVMFYSIYFPMFFALGSRFSSFLDLIVIFAIGGVILIVFRVLEWMDVHVSGYVRHILSANSADQAMYGWWAGGGCLVLFIVSWFIAIYVYERRNL